MHERGKKKRKETGEQNGQPHEIGESLSASSLHAVSRRVSQPLVATSRFQSTSGSPRPVLSFPTLCTLAPPSFCRHFLVPRFRLNGNSKFRPANHAYRSLASFCRHSRDSPDLFSFSPFRPTPRFLQFILLSYLFVLPRFCFPTPFVRYPFPLLRVSKNKNNKKKRRIKEE